jgi:hypothetical protein
MTTSQRYRDFIASVRADRRERSVPDAAPVEVSAEAIVRCYKIALGELTDVPALDPDSPAGQIVKAYEKALEKELPSRSLAPAVAPVAKSQEETEA